MRLSLQVAASLGSRSARPGDSTLARSLLRSVGRAGRAGRASCGARTALRKRAAPHQSPRDPFAPPARSPPCFLFFSLFLFLSSVLWRPVRAVAAVELLVAEVSPACGWLSGRLIVGRRPAEHRKTVRTSTCHHRIIIIIIIITFDYVHHIERLVMVRFYASSS